MNNPRLVVTTNTPDRHSVQLSLRHAGHSIIIPPANIVCTDVQNDFDSYGGIRSLLSPGRFRSRLELHLRFYEWDVAYKC